MIQIFEHSFDLSDIPEIGTICFHSDLQSATVEIYRDGDKVYRRHCGTSQGSFWTEYEEVNG